MLLNDEFKSNRQDEGGLIGCDSYVASITIDNLLTKSYANSGDNAKFAQS